MNKIGMGIVAMIMALAGSTAFAQDCNQNGVIDLTDITSGTSQDCNSNNVPDECDLGGLPINVYWIAVSPSGVNSNLRRAILDGSPFQDIIMGLSHPRGMTIDQIHNKLYWVNTGSGEIKRANLDGTSAQIAISSLSNAVADAAVDGAAGKIYWGEPSSNKLRRANLDGSNQEDLITNGLNYPVSITLDSLNGKMYWVDLTPANKVRRAALNGTGPEILITGTANEFQGVALDVPASKMYLSTSTGKIQWANLDGTIVQDLIPNAGATRIAVDHEHGKIYWTGASTIQRANLDGSQPEIVFNGAGTPPWGIALHFPSPVSQDCNNNGIPDSCDIAGGFSQDCNNNGIPDSCDIAGGSSLDCNNNGIPDSCDIGSGTSYDCNQDQIPDECQPVLDADGDGIQDGCDNCLMVVNPDQENNDLDAFGNACDNCPNTFDLSQTDSDSDGLGDLCDNCPGVVNPGQEDCDNDGYGDACGCSAERGDMNGDGLVNALDTQLFVERLLRP